VKWGRRIQPLRQSSAVLPETNQSALQLIQPYLDTARKAGAFE
jgi:hypothetical protein